MEVVIPFTERQEGGDEVVTWRASIIERVTAEEMRNAVDAEGGVMHEDQAHHGRHIVATLITTTS